VKPPRLSLPRNLSPNLRVWDRMQRLLSLSRRQVRIWICLFCGLLFWAATDAVAQHKGNRLRPRYLSSSPPDQERGREVLQKFQQMGLAGDYYLGFDLEVLPRRGDRSVVPGRMWGSRVNGQPVFRAQLAGNEHTAPERVLSVNGPEPKAWRRDDAAQVIAEVEPDVLMTPLAGTDLSLFELQMPFVFWPDFIYEGTTEVRGRAVHAFLMYPPADFAAAQPDLAGVRLHLDANFGALMQAVFLDAQEQPNRKMTVLDLKKLGDQWIVRTIEVRDEATRDKVRFRVTAAALDLDLSDALFTPDFLSQDVAAPVDAQPLRW